MLNTAATRMYWKHEIKKSAEFSKFGAPKPSEESISNGGGGKYLENVGIEKIAYESLENTHHCSDLTQKNAQNCAPLVISTCPIMLVRTFFDTRLAVGRLV
jgi:hypothetical protein